jgi:hypothetical protein
VISQPKSSSSSSLVSQNTWALSLLLLLHTNSDNQLF